MTFMAWSLLRLRRLAKCLLCMHAIFDLQVELGSKEDVYSGEDSDDGLDKQSDANIELNMGIYKQSRRQTALVVPGWVYSEQPRWVCQLRC